MQFKLILGIVYISEFVFIVWSVECVLLAELVEHLFMYLVGPVFG
jgi:hypothetical protein